METSESSDQLFLTQTQRISVTNYYNIKENQRTSSRTLGSYMKNNPGGASWGTHPPLVSKVGRVAHVSPGDNDENGVGRFGRDVIVLQHQLSLTPPWWIRATSCWGNISQLGLRLKWASDIITGDDGGVQSLNRSVWTPGQDQDVGEALCWFSRTRSRRWDHRWWIRPRLETKQCLRLQIKWCVSSCFRFQPSPGDVTSISGTFHLKGSSRALQVTITPPSGEQTSSDQRLVWFQPTLIKCKVK